MEKKCAKTTSGSIVVSSSMMSQLTNTLSTSTPVAIKEKLNQRHRRFIGDNYNTFHARDLDYDNGEFLKITNHSGQLGFGSFGGKIENSDGIWGDPHIFNTSHKETPKQSIDSVFHDESVSINSSEKQVFTCGEVFIDYTKVSCTPEPDAFNPCEDVMGYKWLRIFVWLVVMAALLGNIAVLFVLISSRSKMTVTKFLMCNLAFADFLMGLYLLLLASIDAHSLGEYFNYAILWQNEGGCQAAGFLSIFSSELSIFTLTVITLERWYAISHAIHLTKRLKLRQAMFIMAFGWSYAAFMAHLPLVGVSDYGTVSVCLPMKVETGADLAFILSLLVINGCAFLVICVCYLNMYFRVRGSESTANSSDATIAKRMAMLVFTNFICYAPIAFFGLTASAGLPLIDITNSKILLVFFYPLNSCANPYLYVIITKQFRKDLYVLLGKYGICTERANRYKLSITHSKTVTHSRKDSLALNNVIHPVERSLTQFTGSFRSSKGSRNGTPCITPQNTPYREGHSPDSSVRFPTDSESKSGENKSLERKLSIVPEINQASGREMSESGHVDERTTGSPLSASVRSASEYVIFFPPNKREQDETRYKPAYEHQMSHSTYLSSNSGTTEHSTFSDGSFDDPWVLQDCVKHHSDVSNSCEPIQEEETCKPCSNSCEPIQEEDTCKPCDGNDDDSDNDDDKVQQTLLKHCTIRDSPDTTKNQLVKAVDLQRVNGDLVNGYVPRSPSTCSLEEFDENSSLFNEINLS